MRWATSRAVFAPSSVTEPWLGCINPATTRSSVLLPAPLSPTTTYSRPGAKLSVISRKAANRPKNFTRFVRTMTGWLDESVVPVMGCVAVRPSGGKLLALGARLGSAQLRLLGILARHRSRSRLLGCILRGAFSLDVGRMEHAIVSPLAFGQCLSIVFKSVWRSLAARVNHGNRPPFFGQQKFEMSPLALDRSRSDVAGHAQPLAVGVRAHAVEFFDGDVITFAVAHSRVGEIGQRHHDNNDDCAKAQISASLH